MSGEYSPTILGDRIEDRCFICENKTDSNIGRCNGCGELGCSACLKFGEVCGKCYQLDIDHMIQIHSELKLVYRFWISVMIGFVLQAPFSLAILLNEVTDFVNLSVELMDIIFILFGIIVGTFLLAYPGYLYYARKVDPYDERMEKLENYERLYGKIKIVLKDNAELSK